MSALSLSGKTIAITGGASGIGLATAKILSSLGANVSIADLSAESLEKVKAEIVASGGSVFVKATDVRRKEQVDAWISGTVERFGSLDGAANLAGVIGKNHGKGMVSSELPLDIWEIHQLRGNGRSNANADAKADIIKLVDMEEDEWDFVMDVNVKGVRNCMQSQLKVIPEGGSIVNAASIAGLMGMKGCSVYSASKHAVIGLTRSVAKEVGTRQIRVNCVAPGVTETPMLNQSKNTSGSVGFGGAAVERKGQPEEVANLVVFLLGKEASFITGACYSVDGGWHC